MGYIEDLREQVGNYPLILVRPSVAIINSAEKILLVKYQDHSWGIPGGLMELGETVEQCLRRETKEELNLELNTLKLLDVYSGKELYIKLRNGHECYNVIIAYICTDYQGDLIPDGEEVIEAQFFDLFDLPDSIQPFIKEKIQQSVLQTNPDI